MTFALLYNSPFQMLAVLSLNGEFKLGSVFALPQATSGFILGQSFSGVLRDFRVYSSFLSVESFSNPA